MSAPPRVVAIGGGHGLARALEALRLLSVEPTAVVTVADDGGSSGRLRRDLGIIAVGDLRMALLTLARDRQWPALLSHRFGGGQLRGHALGNLLLLALAERTGGDFVAALDEAARLLGCAGRVLPATTEPVELRARIAGTDVGGQVQVATATGRVERVWLEPSDAPACDAAVADIADADLVLLGPGSLYTSVLAALLVPGVARAVAHTRARVVYLANIVTQPGETEGLDADDHVRALFDHVPGLHLDVVVLHDGPVPDGPGAPLGTAVRDERVGAVVRADLVPRSPGQGTLQHGHDPARLAEALAALVAPERVALRSDP